MEDLLERMDHAILLESVKTTGTVTKVSGKPVKKGSDVWGYEFHITTDDNGRERMIAKPGFRDFDNEPDAKKEMKTMIEVLRKHYKV